jgi:hypothetical protein
VNIACVRIARTLTAAAGPDRGDRFDRVPDFAPQGQDRFFPARREKLGEKSIAHRKIHQPIVKNRR